MKKLYFLFFLTIGFFANAQIVSIPDANFKAKLLSASPSNTIASTETPVYNSTTDTWSVSSYNSIDTNSDGEIQVSEALAIKWLKVNNSSIISSTGLETFSNLQYFDCGFNQLTSLNVTSLSNLLYFNCINNDITSLNILGLINLKYLHSGGNLLSSLNVSGLTSLESLYCDGNQLTILDVSDLTNLKTLSCGTNLLTNLNVSNLINLTRLFCNSNRLTNLDVSNLINLRLLFCPSNQISNLDVTSLTNLISLNCNSNQLTNLNVSGLTNLTYLECGLNQLSNLDVSSLINLQLLYFPNNLLTSVDLSNLLNLQRLYCNSNQLTNLNVSGLLNLQLLFCSNNLISEFNFTNNPQLNNLSCGANNITTLDVSNLNNLARLNCNNSSNLTYINMKNGSIEDNSFLNFDLCPNLEFICCDDAQLTQVQNLITTYNYTSCSASALDCTYPFPNELSGNVKYDFWEDGCDVLDIVVPNVKYNVFDGTDTFVTFGNQDGNYFMSLVDGNYSITPVVEQPNYFNVSPNNVTINFPALTSPHVQDFCVTWNQIDYFDDLEVTILPMSPARPGYEAVYKVMVRNKGFDTTYGTVSLTYDNSILTYVSSNPLFANTTTNSLSWDILQIIPFEVLEYEVRFNLNNPTASPPVNNGDELHFTAQVAHEVYIEYTPDDNTFTLDQTVVGSYDPNDKVCLQGETEEASIVGEYVHYMIRFENTGTFLAEKVVVEDFIDISKFDIATLIPLNASHAYYKKITGNKVEFIFNDINLDFNNPNNDGFIAFKLSYYLL